MASGYNRIIIVGNLTRDPELKQLPSGQVVCRLNVASNRQFRNRQSGDMVQEVCYIDVDVWGAQAESCKNYLQKGRQVLIEGRLKLDSWQDAQGNNRSKHSVVADRVVFLASSGGADQSEVNDNAQADNGAKSEESFEPRNDMERELMTQLNDIKKRAGATALRKPAPAQQTSAQETEDGFEPVGLPAFKDEPPFQDDLPF